MPKEITETLSPVLPRLRYFIFSVLSIFKRYINYVRKLYQINFLKSAIIIKKNSTTYSNIGKRNKSNTIETASESVGMLFFEYCEVDAHSHKDHPSNRNQVRVLTVSENTDEVAAANGDEIHHGKGPCLFAHRQSSHKKTLRNCDGYPSVQKTKAKAVQRGFLSEEGIGKTRNDDEVNRYVIVELKRVLIF